MILRNFTTVESKILTNRSSLKLIFFRVPLASRQANSMGQSVAGNFLVASSPELIALDKLRKPIERAHRNGIHLLRLGESVEDALETLLVGLATGLQDVVGPGAAIGAKRRDGARETGRHEPVGSGVDLKAEISVLGVISEMNRDGLTHDVLNISAYFYVLRTTNVTEIKFRRR